jgi:hypothetical protein
MTNDPVGVLEVVAKRARWAQMASRVLAGVRRINESDEETLRRIVDDYRAMVAQIHAAANLEERGRLGDKYKGVAPRVLVAILARSGALEHSNSP